MKNVIYTRSQEEQQRRTEQWLFATLLLYVLLPLVYIVYFFVSLAAANTEICPDAGKAKGVAWFDTWQPGQPRTAQQSQATTNCPASATVITDASNHTFCFKTALVKPINAASGFGDCQDGNNVLTEECFAEDVCKYYSGTDNYMCWTESVRAAVNYFKSGTLDCNNMTGSWQDEWGAHIEINQVNLQTLLSGQYNTDTATDPESHCGTWDISGVIDGRGNTDIYVNNPDVIRYPLPRCRAYFKYLGITGLTLSKGTWSNDIAGNTGPYVLHRLTAPPGLTTAAPWTASPPPAFAITGYTAGDGYVTLTWSAVPGARYQVQIQKPGGSWIPASQIRIPTSFRVNGVVNYEQWGYRIQALLPFSTITSAPIYTTAPCNRRKCP